MTLQSLTDLLIDELYDLYDAEKQVTNALPLMAKKVFSSELQELLQEHLEQTNRQVQRLEKIFEHLKVPIRKKQCQAMAGIIAEAEEMLKEESDADPNVLDAAVITAAQKVEHYEIAGYGCARTHARTICATDVYKLLQETLDEEEITDRQLSALAEGMVNIDAAESDEEIIREAESI